MKPKTIVIGTVGLPASRRYYITDMDGNYWSENTNAWTVNLRQATLYSDPEVAATTICDTVRAQMDGELLTFTTEVQVEVKTMSPVSAEQLGDWLRKCVKVSFDPRHGIGPVENSMAILRINWSDLKKGHHKCPSCEPHLAVG